MKNAPDKRYIENKNTYFGINNFFFSFRKLCREKNGAAIEATDDNVIRRMRTACWINKTTNAHWQ